MTSRIEYNNPAANDKLGLSYHYEMVSDSSRVTPFKLAIQKAVPGKLVLESGMGSGILSILAARAGAEHVYATEIDPDVAAFAQDNIKKNGLQDKITILRKDTRDLTLDDIGGKKVDVVIAENLSTWEVNETQIAVMNHINQNLIIKTGVRIPQKIFNTLELVHSQFNFEEAIDLRTYFFQFTGIKAPQIMSNKVIFSEIDLSKIYSLTEDRIIEVSVNNDGLVNSLRLTSPLQVLDDIKFEASDSLMPPVIVPLTQDKKVKKGDVAKIRISYKCNTDWSNFVAEIWL